MKNISYFKLFNKENLNYVSETIHTLSRTKPFGCIVVKIEPDNELFVRKGYIATNIGKNIFSYDIFKIYRQREIEEQAIMQLKDELKPLNLCFLILLRNLHQALIN